MLNQNELTAQIEGDFIAMIDEWHSLPEVWDNDLDAQIHRWYAGVKPVFPKRPYFSPSSANSCPRELYMKGIGAKRDNARRQPHQARWQRQGTVTGDYIQRDILFIEKHFERLTGNVPPFRFLKDKHGRPAFEEFAKTNRKANIDGVEFYLYGAPDGIMEYISDNGEIIRVGLEIKTKQTTPARTSLYTMRNAEESHIKQCVAYSYMYDLDYYVILYVNGAKQRWVMSEEEYEKTPDIRAFCYEITDVDRYELLADLADVQQAINERKPPAMDIDKWMFNNYKQATAESLTNEELDELLRYRDNMLRSSMPNWRKEQVNDAVEQIKELRKGAE